MEISLDAEWTDDCCGKKDYDGDIVSISTRYWPPGGGYFVVNNAPEKVTIGEAKDGSLPNARSSLIIRVKDNDYIVLEETNIEGQSLEEVKQKVEEWAQGQYKNIISILRNHFVFKDFNGKEI